MNDSIIEVHAEIDVADQRDYGKEAVEKDAVSNGLTLVTTRFFAEKLQE